MEFNVKSNQIKTRPKEKNLKLKSIFKATKEVLLDFWSSTSIHGLRYLGMRKWYERVCWMIICLVSLFFCGQQVLSIWTKWNQNPIHLLLERKFTSVQDVLFPAITFCGQRTFNQSVYNYTKTLTTESESPFENDTIADLLYFKYMTMLCYYSVIDKTTRELMTKKLKQFPTYQIDSTKDHRFLQENLPTGHSTIFDCDDNVDGKYVNWDCAQSFYRILIPDGICYSFNMKPRKEIIRPGVILPFSETPFAIQYNMTPEIKGPIVNYSVTRQYPFKFTHSRHFMQFATLYNKDFCDESCDPEINMYIHNHDELPWDSTYAYTVPAKRYSYIRFGLRQQKVVTSTDLHKISPKQRSCYFKNERPLKYFLNYSKSNCELECWANQVEKNCKCVPFWIPHFVNATICEAVDLDCIYSEYVFDTCDCMVDCDSTQYYATIQNVYYLKKDEDHITTFEFYYIEGNILSIIRKQAYTITDFIAQVGGIFGLFLGCSILSIVEIIYFCTVRLFLKLRDAVNP